MVVLLLLFLTSPDLRAEVATASTPQFVDQVYESIFKLKSKKKDTAIPKIEKARRALEQNRFDQARTFASQIKRDHELLDIGDALTAEADLGELETIRQNGSLKKITQLAKKILGLYQKIQLEFPESPYLNGVDRKMAQAELIWATAIARNTDYSQAVEIFSRAFHRLNENKSLARTRLEFYAPFVTACSKMGDHPCLGWIRRLAKIAAKGSKEMKVIEAGFKTGGEVQFPSRAIDRLTRTYKGADLDEEAFAAALKKILAGDCGDAVDLIDAFLKEYPKSSLRNRAQFWAGRCLLDRKKPDKAQEYFDQLLRESPLSFYGINASMVGQKTMEQFIDTQLPRAASSDLFLTPGEERAVNRAKRLIANGDFKSAGIELATVGWKSSQLSNEFLAFLASMNFEIGNHLSSFRIMSELFSRGYPEGNSTYWLRLLFPVEFKKEIRKYSKENQLDAILILSQIKQESAFDSDAVSHVGASGLMQIMPYTATDIDADVEMSHLADPEVSVRLGTSYMATLLRRFNGNIVQTLAGYNAGPSRAATWIKESDSRWGMLEFIESIPYKETRTYVQAILRNYYWYSYRMTGKRLPSFDYFWGVSGPTVVPMDFPNSN